MIKSWTIYILLREMRDKGNVNPITDVLLYELNV